MPAATSTKIIILDTNVIRDIVMGDCLTDAFVALVREGGTIHIADGAFVEILSWLHTTLEAWSAWERARSRFDEFIDPKAPVMMGGREVLAQAGLVFGAPPSTFLPDEQLEVNRQIWQQLMRAKSLREASSLYRLVHAHGKLSRLHFNALGAPNQVARQKDSWVDMFDGYAEAAKAERFSIAGGIPQNLLEERVATIGRFLDGCCTSSPPASMRMDAMLRIHLLLSFRSLQKKRPYNAKKNQNDAFDFDLYRYLALPAALCTSDKGIFNDLCAGNAWQIQWVAKPEELLDSERRRQILDLHWPERG